MELQPQESKPSKTGNALQKALTGSPFIQNAHDADIGAMLKYVMIKVGLRATNLPDEIEKKVLIDHIKKNYPANTLDEIRLAFEMAINEQLDLSPDQITCYENFSCLYFSRIMNAYQSWAAQEYKMLRHEPPAQRIYTEEEIDNFYRQWTEEFYQRLRNGRMTEVPDYVKIILTKDGLIPPDGSAVNFLVYSLGIGKERIYEKAK